MKLKMILMALLLAFVCAFVAQADTTTFKGQTIRYTGTVNVTGEDSTYRLFTFTSGTGTIILPSDVTADILAVGGGGGGGGGRRSGSKTYTYTGGSGGGGGGVDERKGVSLSAQTLSISVGDGGAGGSYSTSSNQAGSQGSESKVYNGSTNYAKADGGAGGAGGNASNDGQGASGQTGTDKRDGKSSEVSGTLMTYGVGGQKTNNSNTTRSARTTNTGNGGNGATKPGGSNSQHYVGQGGDSGVVIVKITDIDEPKPVASLISGTIPVGAYDVEILNASRTNWVDGELVITYLNTDAFVAKSFTLPKQTTGQLLAVGGGGAGGQDSSYSKDSGLPGGGGAGGLVFSDNQAFSAAKYWVTVGAGGVAPRGTMNRHAGANGEDSTVTCAGETFANALGGGGGGAGTEAARSGGCGGGGSYSGTTAGSSIQESDAKMGVGFAGGAGNDAKFGGGGGGAGGAGKPTSTADSGAGGSGLELGITGANVVYARGGDGGVPRVYAYQYYDERAGKKVLTNTSPDKNGKINGYRAYYVEASDGKPGLEGRGNGGGGGGHYGLGGKNDTAATYAGSGGNGVVIVRISPYSISVEDALKRAFAGQSVTVSGSQVTLTGDVSGPIGLPDNIGAVTIDLAGHAIVGADGAAGEPVDITPGGDGEPAIRLVPHVYTCEAGRTQVMIRGSGGLVGGNGGNGYPGGRGSAAVARAAGVGTDVTVDTGAAAQTSGADGETYVQHAHVWTYKQVGNEIHATCVATDGEPCSYKNPEHALKIVLHADDVEFTGARYDSAGVDNGILPVVGIPTGIVFYEGREDKGTVYPKSATPPTDAGYYLATLTFNGMTMEKDFSIIEGKMQQDTVYQSTKTAVRSGSDVLITLRASYDGAKAINYGNVLFLGSRCSAHSMKAAALAGAINALTPFANVQWYAYGSTDPTENKSGYTAKGQQVQESEFTLVGANHFVYDRMMDDLYAELVENRNNRAYDMVILEFDGDLLGRNHLSPYQLTYTLPDGWTDEKAAILRTAMSAFYDANRVVWVVPNVDVTKEDSGYTGAYPWTSKPEFVWQRVLLNATEDAGYCCPLQKNYEDADELISFMQQALIGAYFKKVKITDKIADGLSFSKDDVATEFRDVDGLWKNACPSAVESRYGTTITATKTVNGRTVAVEFDTSAFQAEALRREALVNNDVRVTIRARIEDEFFSGLGGGAPKDTNVGDATFVYSGGEDVGDFTNNVPPASIPNVKPDPIYEAKDYVGYYDAEGHTITVTVIDPDPAVKTPDIRYSLEKDGSYDKDLLLTNVCEAVNVWFTLTAEGYATVTNYAKVTIRPRVVELTAEDATKAYDGDPLTTNGFTVASVTPEDYAQGKGFVPGEGIDKVTMTDDSQQTEVGNHPNVVNPDKSTMIPKTGTDLDNYIVITHPGTLTVTSPLSMGIEAFPVEKFYDAEGTNITWAVTNAQGVAITDATIFLREKGTDSWIPAAEFAPFVDTTNVIVEVRAQKTGFGECFAEATVVINPRPVTLIAASDSKSYDGLPLTNWTFTVKEDTATEGYGFVKDEGVASVTMTPESTITLPGSQPNEIATSVAKEGTKLERNYVVSTEPGTLTVTAASMGIEAFPAEKFYDAEGTNITWAVTNATGGVISDATISLREKGTDNWIPAADFTPYVDTTNVIVEVRAEKSGFDPVEAEATVIIDPRPVTLIAASDSKVYDGLPLTNWTFTVKEDTTTPGYGFAKEEGVDRVTMTPESTVTLPDTKPNVIGTTVALPGTKLERNYIVDTVDGTLTVTAATMGIEVIPAEKFYDAEPTNITWVVTNANGVAITDATISLREKGTDTWIPVADFTPYVDTTNVIVEVKAEKSGFGDSFAEATVDVWPRPVTLIAASDSKVYDGLPLTNWTFEVKEDTTTPGYGFVKDEGVASVTMTPESTVTLPDTVPNVIATEIAKPNTKLERNYIVDTVDGTLTVTAATMGIEAIPAEKFYDAEPTNITWIVTNAAGVAITDATVSLREKGTDSWIPAADFVLYVDTTNVTVEVKAEKSGFGDSFAEATVDVWPRPVTLIAASDSKVYDGLPLTNWTFEVKTDTTTPGYGFVKEEGVASVTMTPESTVTLPDSVPNVIASEIAKPNTKLDRNYIVDTEPGTLTVTAATMGIEAFPAEKFYDAEPTNITWIVTNAAGVAITDATVSLREKGADNWIPAADFVLYVDTTNVTVEVKASKSGFGDSFAEATVDVWPRPVTLIAASDSKVYDGLPLTNWTFEVKTDTTTPGYGFVKEEGVASVTMTPESTITLPGSQPNEIATSVAKEGTKLERNYVVSTEKGTLTVTPAPFTASAEPVEKFYDSTPTNIIVTVSGIPSGVTPTYEYSYSETEGFVPASAFTGPTNVSETAEVFCRVIIPGTTNTVHATATIKPRIVVVHAKDGEWTFDGAVHTQPEYEEDTDVEDTLSKAKWGTDEVLPDSVGFVEGEGYAAELIMTADSAITEPGTTNNVIDQAADKVALAANTRPENYELYYLDGLLTVWQREEEVRRDPEDQQKIEELPEETKNKIREADEKLVNDLKELEEKDVALQDEPFVKYQITVTPKEKLTERSRTMPEIAEAAVAAQEQLVPSADESVYVDITLERTTSKDEVKATDDGNYDKTKWESLDDADAHGRTEILAVTIPLDVPDGMELESVTRSCAGETDRLLPLSPGQEGTTEGFVYDSETKTVTVYAKDFCLFGFHLKAKGTPFNNLCERPLVYDFKASVKHMTLKEVKVNVRGIFNGTVYAKVRKASSLKGYLVVDRAGATSQAVVTGRGTDYNNIPASGMDYGRNRAFLVVRNASAEKAMRKPKILPAVLDAKWIDTAFAKDHAASSGLAEGYLYVGGDAVAGVRPSLAGTPGALMLADYAWTSVYLFGQYNGPRWYVDGALNQSELAINAAQPPDLQIRKGGVAVTPYPTYHDTWMNCAGFGKFFVPSTKKKACCGQANWISCGALPAEPTLSTLSGTLKGGLFLCSESGIVATGSNYETLDGGIWEDQFATARLVPADDFAPDAFQTDLWQDGPAALETTDVLYGNWSIKIRQNGLPDTQITDQGKDSLLAAAEMDALAFGANVRASGVSAKAYPLKHHVEAATGLYVLVGTLKAAVLKLDETATFVETKAADKEIYSKPANARLAVPAITPKFAQYFGLANWW